MKNAISLFRKLVFILVLPYPGLLFGQWLPVANHNAPTEINVVWAQNSSTIFAASDDYMLRSTDGGQSWQSQALSAWPFLFNPEAIHFFDQQHGIMIGDRLGGLAQSYTTHDGGQTWTEATVAGPGPIQIEDVRMVSPSEAFIIGTQGFMAKTTDGGQSWTGLQVPGGVENWVDMEFFDPLHGIVLNKIGQLFRTSDGGANWQLSVTPSQSSFAEMQFFDDANGYLNDPFAGFFRTTDSGQTWETVGPAITEPNGIFFFSNPSTGWSSFAGRVFKTTDGGLTWLMQLNNNGASFFKDIHFSGGVGWICGNSQTGDGLLLKTLNNGGFGINLESYPANLMCSFETNTFTCVHDGATAFRWFVNDEEQSINSPVFVFQPPADGTYGVYCIAENAVQSVRSPTLFLNVMTNPILPFGATLAEDSICAGDRARFVMADVFGNAQYRIQTGNDILYEFTGSNIQNYHWQSEPLATTTTFDFYVNFTFCGGWKKMDSLTVQVVPVPDLGLDLILSDTAFCENEALEIKIVHPQPHILYYPMVYNFNWGIPASGGTDTLTLTSNPLYASSFAGVLAVASSACQAVLMESSWVEVTEINLSFAVSTPTVGLGETLVMENTSPDTLNFQWRYTAVPPNSPNISGSSGQYPEPVQFSQPGTGFITLIGADAEGCTDSLTKTINVLDLSGLSTDWAMPQGLSGQIRIEIDSQGYIYGYNNGNTSLSNRIGNGAEVQGVSGVFYKYSKQGVLQWYNTFDDLDGIPQGARLLDFTVDPAGNTTFLFSLNGVHPGTSFWLSSSEGEFIRINKADCIALARYSPNGVFRWVRFIEPVNNAAGGVSFGSFVANSLGIDSMDNIFLLARNLISQAPDILYSSTREGYIDSIPIAPQTYSNFVIKILPDGHFDWVKDHIKSVQIVSSTLFLTGIMLKPDQTGGCYLWLNAGGNKPYASELIRLDSDGATRWSKVWGLSTFITNSNYIWVNDLQVGPDGSAYLLGSCSAPNTFGTGAHFGNSPGTYLVKVSPDGVPQWARSVVKSALQNSSVSHHALGLAIDGDRIHVLTEFNTPANYIVLDPHCVDTLFSGTPTLFWTSWDTLGNLLQIRPAAISFGGPNTPGTASHRVRAFKGQLIVLGKPYTNNGGSFWGVSLPPNDFSGKGYLAAITDPKEYLPYLNGCTFERCEIDSTQGLQISYLFEDIAWYRNDTLLAGYDQPAIVPPSSGVYRASGVNPNGNTHTSPVPAYVTAIPFPEAVITRVDSGLYVPFYPNVIYLWYDSVGTLLNTGWDNNIYYPDTIGWYRVEIRGTGPCDDASPLFYYDGLVDVQERPLTASFRFRISPNPAESACTLELPWPAEPAMRLRITDLRGKLLLEEPIATGIRQHRVHVADLPGGMYLLQVVQEGRVWGAGKMIRR